MDRLLKILKSIRPNEDFLLSTDFIMNGQLDSFDIITLVTELEKTFSIKIESRDVTPENMLNLETIKLMLEKYGISDFSRNKTDNAICLDSPSITSMEIKPNHSLRQSNKPILSDKAVKAQQQIMQVLKEAGIREGDVILVQSDTSVVMELGGFEQWEDALDLMTDCFLKVLGASGTLIVPTFNWDFCSGKPFEYERSPSQVGMFSNHVLFNRDSVRSLNPILSFAAIGPHAKILFKGLSNSCYSQDSVYQRLHAINAKLIFFNIYLRQANFVHYVEQQKGVNYRFAKEFTGQLRQDEREWEDTYELYVRKDMQKVSTDLRRFEERMYKLGKANEVWISDRYPLVVVKTEDVYDVVFQMLENDPYCLCTTDPESVVMMNMKREHPWNNKPKRSHSKVTPV
jgi:aminoglycoside 3-N-acetyltransferase